MNDRPPDLLRPRYEYTELILGEMSRDNLLQNLLASFGFDHAGVRTLQGSSGLPHQVEALGLKGKNILLVIGGAEKGLGSNWNTLDWPSPKEQMERWRRDALLCGYDLQGPLVSEGWNVDLLFFHNINYTYQMPLQEGEKWLEKYQLNADLCARWASSVDRTAILPVQELAITAQSIGACFVSLDQLTLEEISQLTRGVDAGTVTAAKEIGSRIRVRQYFNPPTDELLLGTLLLSPRPDKELVKRAFDVSVSLGHKPCENVIVPSVCATDPIATAKELEKHTYIHFESKIEVTPQGQKILQTIRKTAQESFIIRILKTLNIPEMVRSLVSHFRRPPSPPAL